MDVGVREHSAEENIWAEEGFTTWWRKMYNDKLLNLYSS
jgi:hypothetical protein